MLNEILEDGADVKTTLDAARSSLRNELGQ